MKAPMKVMKKVLKKPASGENDEPKISDADAITAAALEKLEGQSDNKVQVWLDKLQDKDQQRLWKRFEANRLEECTQQEYKAATSGTGKIKVARNLLKCWLQGGGSTKSANYQKGFSQVAHKVVKGSESKWQPLHFMITQKYGMRELKARVFAGTIGIRACPQDKRFPEFREYTEYELNEISKKVGTSIQNDPAKVEWSDFQALQNLEIQHGQGLQLTRESLHEDPLSLLGRNFGGASSSNATADTLALMGMPGGRPSPSPSPTRSPVGQASPSAAASASSQILANLENSLTLAGKKDVSAKDLKIGYLKCKGACTSTLEQLQTSEAEAEGKDKKKFTGPIKQVSATIRALEKADQKAIQQPKMLALIKKAASVVKKHTSLVED